MDEGFETMTLVQTGKTDLKPIVLLDVPDGRYWHEWREFAEKHVARAGLISEEDWHLLKITNDVEEAISEFVNFYRNFHSLRYVNDKLVIRLKIKPSSQDVEALNDRFADIISGGKIRFFREKVEIGFICVKEFSNSNALNKCIESQPYLV